MAKAPKIVYGDWRVTAYRGKAHATTGFGDNKRRFTLEMPITSPVRFLRAALVAFVKKKEAEKLASADLTVADIYLARVEALKREGKVSARSARSCWTILEPFFGKIDPLHIDDELCQEYAKEQAKAGSKADTIWTHLTHLQLALDYALNSRVLGVRVKVWRPTRSKPRQRVAAPTEVQKMLAAVDDDWSPHMRTVLLLAILTGARRSAILELTWDRVNFDFDTITYKDENVQSYNPLKRGYQKGRATVPMGPLLREYLLSIKEKAVSRFVVEHDGVGVKSVKTAMRSLCRRAGVEGISLHTLRHTLASWAANGGVDSKEIGQVLGHSPGSKVADTVYIKRATDLVLPAVRIIEDKLKEGNG